MPKLAHNSSSSGFDKVSAPLRLQLRLRNTAKNVLILVSISISSDQNFCILVNIFENFYLL
jgi:hypothetical protein